MLQYSSIRVQGDLGLKHGCRFAQRELTITMFILKPSFTCLWAGHLHAMPQSFLWRLAKVAEFGAFAFRV